MKLFYTLASVACCYVLTQPPSEATSNLPDVSGKYQRSPWCATIVDTKTGKIQGIDPKCSGNTHLQKGIKIGFIEQKKDKITLDAKYQGTVDNNGSIKIIFSNQGYFIGHMNSIGDIIGAVFSTDGIKTVSTPNVFYKVNCPPCPHNNRGCLYMAGANCGYALKDQGITNQLIQQRVVGDKIIFTGRITPGSVRHDSFCLKNPAGFFCEAPYTVGAGGVSVFAEAIQDNLYGYGYDFSKPYLLTEMSCACDDPKSFDWHAPSGTKVKDANDAWFCKSGKVKYVPHPNLGNSKLQDCVCQ